MEPILSEEELRALRSAIAPQFGAPQRQATEFQPVPVALIADDKAGESARPAAIRLASRWASIARLRLGHALGVKLGIEYGGIETVHAPMLKEELSVAWSSLGEVAGRTGIVTVAVGGRMIEWIAGQLLGGDPDDTGTIQVDRPPSVTALTIFERAGEIIASSLTDAWREEQNARFSLLHDAARAEQFRFELADSEPLLVLTLNATGPTSGYIRLITRPETMVPPPATARATRLKPEEIATVLGDVPVEVKVELGRTRIRMSSMRTLKPGSVIMLDQAADSLLPVECAGVIKAFGRPAVSRGALAVEIVSHPPNGSKKP